jgi:peptidoglycan hydrolase CwlO-like protein
VVVLITAVLASGPARPATAHLAGKLEDARRRVSELEQRITREEARFQSLQAQLRSLASQIGRGETTLGAVRRDLAATNASIAEAKARLQMLRTRVRSRARSIYMRGPLELVGVLLGSQTMGEFTGRIAYAATLARHDARLMLEVRRTSSELRDQQAKQEQLERGQASQVAGLHSRQRSIGAVFARQQSVMADLAASRVEAQHLVSELESVVGAGELAALRRVAGHGMTIGYGAWASSFLTALGAPTSRNNLIAVVAWEAAEGTLATWNPLATTYYIPGATVYNGSGVKNYQSKEQGIEASVLTLKRPGHGYEAIVASLKAGAESMDTARAINRSDWCPGCAGGTYVIGYVPAVEENYGRYAG